MERVWRAAPPPRAMSCSGACQPLLPPAAQGPPPPRAQSMEVTRGAKRQGQEARAHRMRCPGVLPPTAAARSKGCAASLLGIAFAGSWCMHAAQRTSLVFVHACRAAHLVLVQARKAELMQAVSVLVAGSACPDACRALAGSWCMRARQR